MACVRRCASSLLKTLDAWVFTVFRDTNKRSAISWLLRPCATSSSTSYSRGVIPSFSSISSGAERGSPVRALQRQAGSFISGQFVTCPNTECGEQQGHQSDVPLFGMFQHDQFVLKNCSAARESPSTKPYRRSEVHFICTGLLKHFGKNQKSHPEKQDDFSGNRRNTGQIRVSAPRGVSFRWYFPCCRAGCTGKCLS